MHRGPFNVVSISFSYSQSWYWPPYGHTVDICLMFGLALVAAFWIQRSLVSQLLCFLSRSFFLPTFLAVMPPGKRRRGLSFSWMSQPSFYHFPRIGETYFCLQNVTLSFFLYEQWQLTLNTPSSTCCLSDFSLEFLRSVTGWLLRCVLCLLFSFHGWWCLVPV